MFQRIQHCKEFLETMTLYQLPDIDSDISHANLPTHIPKAVYDN